MNILRLLSTLLLACVLPPAALAQGTVIPGLKHRYSFGNAAGSLGDGTQVADSLGGANGFIRGSGASGTGSGIRLGGGSSASAPYLDLPNASVSGSAEVFPGHENVTYEVWVTVHSNQNWSRVLDFGNNSTDEVAGPGGTFNGADYLMVSANIGTANSIRFERGGQFLTGGGTQDISGATTVGTRMHLAVTYEVASFQWKLYKNGTQIAAIPTVLGPSTLDDLNVWLGRSNWAGDSNADATYDEFRIYDRALSAGELVRNFQAGPDSVTVVPPLAPTGLAAIPGPDQIQLNWNPSVDATAYYVKRALTSGGPFSTIATTTAPAYLDTTTAGGTTYYYVVSAVTSGQQGPPSNEVAATSVSSEILTGTVIGSPGSWGGAGNTIDKVFDGNLSTFYDAVNASGHWVGLDLGSPQSVAVIKFCPRAAWGSRMVGGVFQVSNVADFSSGVVTLHTITAAPPEGVMSTFSVASPSAYRYVRYLGGTNSYCNVAELEFRSTATAAPPATPAGFAATPGDGFVNLTWNASSGATAYLVKRSTSSGGPYGTIASPAGTSFTDSTAANGTTYHYVVAATNAAGDSPDSTEASVTPTPPPPATPTNVFAIPGNSEVALTWSSSFGATSYKVKRATSSAGPYDTIATPVGTSFTDPAVVNGTTYHYRISSVNSGGESADSGMVSATPTAPLADNTFDSWMEGYPGVGDQTGFGDDPDGDGLPNGVENFLGTNPALGNPGLGEALMSANTFTFRHPQNPTPASDLSAAYRWALIPGTWNSDGASEGGATVEFVTSQDTPVAGVTTVTATITGPLPGRMFFTIEVTRPPTP